MLSSSHGRSVECSQYPHSSTAHPNEPPPPKGQQLALLHLLHHRFHFTRSPVQAELSSGSACLALNDYTLPSPLFSDCEAEKEVSHDIPVDRLMCRERIYIPTEEGSASSSNSGAASFSFLRSSRLNRLRSGLYHTDTLDGGESGWMGPLSPLAFSGRFGSNVFQQPLPWSKKTPNEHISSSSSRPSAPPLFSTLSSIEVRRSVFLPSESYTELLDAYVELAAGQGGGVPNISQRLIYHPSAPCPAVVLQQVLERAAPRPALIACALEAIANGFHRVQSSTGLQGGADFQFSSNTEASSAAYHVLGWSSREALRAVVGQLFDVDEARTETAAVHHPSYANTMEETNSKKMKRIGLLSINGFCDEWMQQRLAALAIKALIVEGLVEEALAVWRCYFLPSAKTNASCLGNESAAEAWAALIAAAAQHRLPDGVAVHTLLAVDEESTETEIISKSRENSGVPALGSGDISTLERRLRAELHRQARKGEGMRSSSFFPVQPFSMLTDWERRMSPDSERNEPLFDEDNEEVMIEGDIASRRRDIEAQEAEPPNTSSSPLLKIAVAFQPPPCVFRYNIEHGWSAGLRADLTLSPSTATLCYPSVLRWLSSSRELEEAGLITQGAAPTSSVEHEGTGDEEGSKTRVINGSKEKEGKRFGDIVESIRLSIAMAASMSSSRIPVLFGLSAGLTQQLMLRVGLGFGGVAPTLLAYHFIQRYVETCLWLREVAEKALETAVREIASIQRFEAWKGEEHALPCESCTTSLPTPERSSALSEWAPAVAKVEKDRHQAGGVCGYWGTQSSLLWPMKTAGLSLSCGSPSCSMDFESLLKAWKERIALDTAPHPANFFLLFRFLREARDAVFQQKQLPSSSSSSSLAVETAEPSTAPRSILTSLVHWKLGWRSFQLLNKTNPNWYCASVLSISSDETEEAARDVLHLLCRGANPWMTLNVARNFTFYHMIDGVEVALVVLHRIDPHSHHPEEARTVSRQIFHWLLADVGLHLQPSLHRYLVALARVLIRLELMQELKHLYSVVLDHTYAFSATLRASFLNVMKDLVCPECSGLLLGEAVKEEGEVQGRGGDRSSSNSMLTTSAGSPSIFSRVYEARQCPNCLITVEGKAPGTSPSFSLTSEHVARIRAKRRAESLDGLRQRLDLSKEGGASGLLNSNSKQKHHKWIRAVPSGVPKDAADVFQRRVLCSENDRNSLLLPGVPLGFAKALHAVGIPPPSSKEHADLEQREAEDDLPAAIAESSRRLNAYREARAKALHASGFSIGGENRSRRTNETEEARLRGLDALVRSGSADMLHAATSSPPSRGSGSWICIWCREAHGEWSHRMYCRACGAETGPQASFRLPSRGCGASPEDIMAVLREDMLAVLAGDGTGVLSLSSSSSSSANAALSLLERAVTCTYRLMVYRRTFLLSASPEDHRLLCGVIDVLIAHHERFLAAHLFTRFLPPADRLSRQRGLLLKLAELFRAHVSSVALLRETAKLGGQVPTGVGPKEASAHSLLPSLASGLPSTEEVKSALIKLTDMEVCSDEILFPLLFTPHSCKICFGLHAFECCPLLTRKFPRLSSSPSSPHHPQMKLVNEELAGPLAEAFWEPGWDNLTPPGALEMEGAEYFFEAWPRTTTPYYRWVLVANEWQHLLEKANEKLSSTRTASLSPPEEDGVEARVSADASIEPIAEQAYHIFTTTPYRQRLAEVFPVEANCLSRMLTRLGQPQRGAFVLLHIPLADRERDTYLCLLQPYGVEAAEVQSLLAPLETAMKESAALPSPTTASYPNFMQVVHACCFCMNKGHASVECPRLFRWIGGIFDLRRASFTGESRNSTPSPSRQGLLSQLYGWLGAGLERCHMLSRFLLQWVTSPPHALPKQESPGPQATPPPLLSSLPDAVLRRELRFGGSGSAADFVDKDDVLVVALNLTILALLRHHVVAQRRCERIRRSPLPSGHTSHGNAPPASTLELANAKELFAHTPVMLLYPETTMIAMLRVGDADGREEMIRQLSALCSSAASTKYEKMSCSPTGRVPLTSASTPPLQVCSSNRVTVTAAAAAAAIPLSQHCLLCFSTYSPHAAVDKVGQPCSHVFCECPRWTIPSSPDTSLLDQQIRLACQEISSLTISFPQGPCTAAAALLLLFQEGKLNTSLLRREKPMVELIEGVITQCCAHPDSVELGARLLRCLPAERILESLATPSSSSALLVSAYWRGAGVTNASIQERLLMLSSLPNASSGATNMNKTDSGSDSSGENTSISSPSHHTPGRNSFRSLDWPVSMQSTIFGGGLCPRCGLADHSLGSCKLFYEEVNFGRDYLASYRMAMIAENLSTEWRQHYLLSLYYFFQSHRLFMPYHVPGVVNALNAMSAIWAMMGEPGVATAFLTSIPPALRRRQTLQHVLNAYNIPASEIKEVIGRLFFASEKTSESQAVQYPFMDDSLRDGTLIAAVGFVPRDDFMGSVVERFPEVREGWQQSGSRMRWIEAQYEQEEVMLTSSPHASAHNRAAVLDELVQRKQQVGGIYQLREDFFPILARLEDELGMKLGSRHELFGAALEVLPPAGKGSSDESLEERTTISSPSSTKALFHGESLSNSASSAASVKEERPTLHFPCAPEGRKAGVVAEPPRIHPRRSTRTAPSRRSSPKHFVRTKGHRPTKPSLF